MRWDAEGYGRTGLSPHVVEVVRHIGDFRMVDFHSRGSDIMRTGVSGSKRRRWCC
jgi:hypothetical protein